MIKIKPLTAGDKLLRHLINYTKCPICKVDILRKNLKRHIELELAEDHIEGEILEQKLLELKHDNRNL